MGPLSIRSPVNLEDYRRAARRRLPRVIFDIIDGGANDEVSLRANRRAFERITLRPKALADVSVRELGINVLGEYVSMPVLLDPCGTARMAHRDAELAVARAAGRAGTIYAVSTVASYELEAVAREATGALWFQLYPPPDREASLSLIARARTAGYKALCVTIDGAVLGTRERDRGHHLQIPFKFHPKIVVDGARHPRWTMDFIRAGALSVSRASALSPKTLKASGAAIAASANPITSDTMRYIRDAWDGPLVVKGVMRGEEVDELIDLGVQGIVVSNHGGRQLDTVPATIDVLPEIVAATRGRAEVLLDGGVRRGTDVLKAIALGAKAVLFGRPYLFGLASNGEDGVYDVLRLIREEIDTAMALLGCTSLEQVDGSLVGGADSLSQRSWTTRAHGSLLSESG